ncbi:MAG: hypothetical protein OXU75_12480, partial [Deltaproteobacteria bacterium]|nr:hypothetical protein [Deltaproteobacteria bacterium]
MQRESVRAHCHPDRAFKVHGAPVKHQDVLGSAFSWPKTSPPANLPAGHGTTKTMLVQYIVELKKPIVFEDHWPIPMMTGSLRPVTVDDRIVAFEISFGGQDTELAPALQEAEDDDVKAHIIGRDKLLPFVKMQIDDAFAYLQCYFDVDIATDEMEVRYIAESDDEERNIRIKSFKVSRNEFTPTIPYDMFTRAMMAAERAPAPRVESGLLKMARTELIQERYIDSFRYSFLLIEAIYGDGNFRTSQLKTVLKRSPDFSKIVSTALNERIPPKHHTTSDTERLLAGAVTVDTVIDHIVDKRGFYFHAVVSDTFHSKNSWLWSSG